MRFPSVDILRSLAIIVMVLVHFAENLAGVALPFAGLGAPHFAILSGISYRLWLNGQIRREISEDEISIISIRRGLFVFCVGFAFNIFVWLPEDTFNWDVLTFIGIGILILNQMRHLPASLSIMSAGVILFMTPFLQAMADFPAYWTSGYFEVDLTLPDVLIGFLVTGYFPLFPWVTYTLVGFSMATILFPPYMSTAEQIATRSTKPFILLGAGCILLSMLLLQLRIYAPPIVTEHLLKGWTMFPSSWEYVLFTVGLAVCSFSLLHQYVDRRPNLNTDSRFFSICKIFSRYAFTIYLLHHMVHLWPLWVYGYMYGTETTQFWRIAMTFNTSMILAVIYLILTYLIIMKLPSEKRYGVESWMRWLCG